MTCVDVNECDVDNGGCSQICTNTNGSFTCECNNGYLLHSDGTNCTDVNECDVDNGSCSQICTNTDGSFTCECNNGYLLHSDGTNCADVNECDVDNGGCSQRCTNTEGSFNCGCTDGYMLDVIGKICIDINECANDSTDGSTDVSQNGCQICTNTNGSFYCECFSGYQLSDDLMTCVVPSPSVFSKVEQENAVIVTLSNLTEEEFTGEIQNTFKNITAQAISMYCEPNPEKCNIIPDDGSKKRDIHLTLQDLLKRQNTVLVSADDIVITRVEQVLSLIHI